MGRTLTDQRRMEAEAYAAAREAAKRADPKTMMKVLYQTHIVDGLVRRFQSEWAGKWPPMPAESVDWAVVAAIDAAYQAIRSGRKILNFGSFVYATAHNLLCEASSTLQREAADSTELLPQLVAPSPDAELEREERRLRAVKIIKETLLPTLGAGNVQEVMRLLLDSIAEGCALSNEEIADTLGEDKATVAVWRSRGLARLAARAKEMGITDLEDEMAEISSED